MFIISLAVCFKAIRRRFGYTYTVHLSFIPWILFLVEIECIFSCTMPLLARALQCLR
jgi:hypothetical protein